MSNDDIVGIAREKGKRYADSILKYITTDDSVEKAKRDLAHGYQAGYIEGINEGNAMIEKFISDRKQLRSALQTIITDCDDFNVFKFDIDEWHCLNGWIMKKTRSVDYQSTSDFIDRYNDSIRSSVKNTENDL